MPPPSAPKRPLLYMHDAIEDLNEALRGITKDNSRINYVTAMRCVFRDHLNTPVAHLTKAVIDASFQQYLSTRGHSRSVHARQGWIRLRAFIAERDGVQLPPGAALTDRWATLRGDTPLYPNDSDPVRLEKADLEELRALVAAAGRTLRLSDIVALRWEGMRREPGEGSAILVLTLASGAELTVVGDGLHRILRKRHERLGKPVDGPIFPRVPGSRDPLPLKLLSEVIYGGLDEVDFRGPS